MGKSICFLTGSSVPKLLESDALVAKQLTELGYEVEVALWNEKPSISSNTIIIRTTWEYYKHLEEFLHFLRKQLSEGKRILNSIATVEWNSDKVYLRDLEEKGILIVPTIFVNKGENVSPLDFDKVIIKPSVSAGAWKTAMYEGEISKQISDHIEKFSDVKTWLIQPYIKEIETAGEWSLIYFDGKFSHAVLKVPKQGDFRVQSEFGGQVVYTSVCPDLIENGYKILDLLDEVPLYARVDGVVIKDSFHLMELELIEPELFTTHKEDALRFTHAIHKNLS